MAITAGPDGAVWFTADGSPALICRMTTAGEVTAFPVVSAPGGPLHDICLGPDGNLWFTESSPSKIGRCTPSGVITEFPVPVVNNVVVGIAAGPDGNIWFTIPAIGIGRLNLNVLAGQEGTIAVPTLGTGGLLSLVFLIVAAGYYYIRLFQRA